MTSIADLLRPPFVHCHVDAPSRKRALQFIADQISDDEAGSGDLFDALMSRERLGSTGLGDGVAIPHCRVQDEQMRAVFISLAEPVDFEASDGQPVDLLCALIVPESEQTAHLDALATLAEVFSDPGNRQRLRQCSSDPQLHECLSDLLATPTSASRTG